MPGVGAGGAAVVAELEGLVAEHEEWRKLCLNMDSAESMSSVRSSRVLSSDLAQRACAGTIGSRNHRGARYIDELEARATALFRQLFRSDYAELQIATGSIANGIALGMLTQVGDSILRLCRPRAHPTFDEGGYAGYRGLRIHDIALDATTFEVDLDQFAEQVALVQPKVVCLGSGVMLFPYPLAEIAAIAHGHGARVLYDGAHVMGLIAAGRFQDPLGEGADVLTGTGYKSFSGPLGGMLFHNTPEYDRFLRPALAGSGFVGTYNHARVVAMAVAAAEQLEFGARFADQMVANAQALGAALEERGFTVLAGDRGYTRTSTIFLDVSRHGSGNPVSALLERANIITMGMQLWQEPGRDGLRVATHEMTRVGMREPEMARIAEYFSRVVLGKEDPDRVGAEVAAFRSDFQRVHFSFDEPTADDKG